MPSPAAASSPAPPLQHLLPSLMVAVLLLMNACSSSGEQELTTCERLHEHVVELTVGAAEKPGSTDATKATLAKHASIRRRVNRKRAVASCEGMTDKEIDCSLAAESIDAYRDCRQGVAR